MQCPEERRRSRRDGRRPCARVPRACAGGPTCLGRGYCLEKEFLVRCDKGAMGSCVNLRLTQDPNPTCCTCRTLTKKVCQSFSNSVAPRAHALGKARPHGRPGRRGAGRPYGFASGPLGTACSFSIVAPSPRANSGLPDSNRAK